MASKKKIISEMLENLTKENFTKFCTALVDREGKPKVHKSKVEDQLRSEVANVVVSTFTEAGAPAIVSELLKEMNCADEATKLETAITEFDKKLVNASPEDTRPKEEATGDKQTETSLAKGLKEVAQVIVQAVKTSQDAVIAQVDKKSLNASPEQTGRATEWPPVQGVVSPSVDRDQFQGHESQKTRTDPSSVEEGKEATQAWMPAAATAQVAQNSQDATITQVNKKSLNASPEQTHGATERRPVQCAVGPSVDRNQFQRHESQKTRTDASAVEEQNAETKAWLDGQDAKTPKDAEITEVDKKSLNASPEQTHGATERQPIQGAVGPSVFRDPFQRHESQGRSFGRQKFSLLEKLAATQALFDDLDAMTSPAQGVTVWRSTMGAPGPSVYGYPFQGHESQGRSYGRQRFSLVENHTAPTQALFDDLDAMTFPDAAFAQIGKRSLNASPWQTQGVTVWRSTMGAASPSVYRYPFQRHESQGRSYGRQRFSLVENHIAPTQALFDDLDAMTSPDDQFLLIYKKGF
ncbi:uncharacterized protein phldb3 isoform X6 [Stigmatopora argus]